MDALESFLPVTPGLLFFLSPLINYDDKTALEHPQNKDKPCIIRGWGCVQHWRCATFSVAHLFSPTDS